MHVDVVDVGPVTLSLYWMLLGMALTVLGLTAVLLGAVLWYLPRDPDRAWWLALISLYYPVYYLLASWGVSVALWRRGRRARGEFA